MSGPPLWSQKYLAVPFVDGGRDMSGADCWGMVRLVLLDRAGIDLPAYGEIGANERARIAERMGRDSGERPWLPTDAPAALDVLLMHTLIQIDGSWEKVIGHVGIMVDSEYVLHTDEGVGVDISKASDRNIKRRFAGYRRHEALVNE